ncbi:hypothetical protein BG015_006261 [Linnemannia schmuckeri]|uniref:Uncharacterized protein n=1 Tax=Linnemannia schmuckeri TaxID=64567 RepID=A0A9P5RZV8_9FUNG|nr:hypothetical protein BG015_006261 [Linnemannia schmuckeri]
MAMHHLTLRVIRFLNRPAIYDANLVCNNCVITNVFGHTKAAADPERLQALKEYALKPRSTSECYYFNEQLYCPFPCSKS